jgi:cytochrome c-type biogenesis protein CcmE
MVETARWVSKNTEVDALVAAHDIGALGYFGDRRLLDLAGLVSPQVIPFIRDEPRLGAWLTDQGAKYLVTFPGWYPDLTRNLQPVYQTGGKFSQAFDGENMLVYRLGLRLR